MLNSITYGDQKIPFKLIENPKLAKKIKIHVHPNGMVEVETPQSKSIQELTIAIRKRAGWISQRLSEVAAVRENVLPREYISGETHFYLGRRYQLKVTETERGRSSVKLVSGLLHINLPIADRTAVKRRLNDWYKHRAENYFDRRAITLSKLTPWVKHAPPIKLHKMQKQWGSCSPDGALHLNPWLIRAPRECVDYVIIHEMCHLKEHNHSKRFYCLLDQCLPQWQHVKTRLDGMAELLLAE